MLHRIRPVSAPASLRSHFFTLINVFICYLLLGFASPLHAQVTAGQSSVNFGASSGGEEGLTFTVPSGITLGGVSVLTQGAPNLDFRMVPEPGVGCANGTTHTTCIVVVQFVPTVPGTRIGAVVLSNQSGNTLITVPLYGTGMGAMLAIGPGTVTPISAPDSLAVALDGAGNLYSLNGNVVQKLTPGGTSTIVAGSSSLGAGYSGDGGAATNAQLNAPTSIAMDGAGSLYIADTGNNVVRKVTPDGIITTLAGNGVRGYGTGGGTAKNAVLSQPMAVTLDPTGNLYIADTGNNIVRMVTPAGAISTFAGAYTLGPSYSGDGGSATYAGMNHPSGVAVDGSGNLYIADAGNDVIRKVTSGTISTVAGGGSCFPTTGNSCSSGSLSFTFSHVSQPVGIAVDGPGNLYVPDSGSNNAVFRISGGLAYSVAYDRGAPSDTYAGNAVGADDYPLSYPTGVAVAGSGNVFIANLSGPPLKVDVSDPPSLLFGGTGELGSGLLTIMNLGNTTLVLEPTQYPPTTDFNFITTASPFCSRYVQPLNTGTECLIPMMLNTTQSVSDSLVLTDNSLTTGWTSQTITLLANASGAAGTAPQTITFPNPGAQTYGVAPITLTAAASSGLAVSYTVTSGPATVSGSTLIITGAGSVTVQAAQAGNSNYAAATPVSVSITVNKGTQTITFPNPSTQSYPGTPIMLTGTASSGLAVGYTVTAGPATVSGSTLTIIGAGTVTVQATQAGNSNYSAATPVSVSFTVNLATPALVSLSPNSAVPGGTAFTLTIYGNNFLPGVGASWNGSALMTTYVSATQLTAAVPAALIATSGAASVTVTNGGSPSSALTFAVGAGLITTVAGNGSAGYMGDGGPATSAELSFPYGVVVDASGNLYIVDSNNSRIRKVTPSGTITTVAGDGTSGYTGDGGSATSAELYFPNGVAVDASGNLYIADTYNNRIRKVTPGGTITTIAGNGIAGYTGDGGPATSAELKTPWSIALDASGDLYFSDSNNSRIRMITPDGTITTVAGNGILGYAGDGAPAISAEFNAPRGVAVDASGNLYIADFGNSRVRMVAPGGTITTVVGNGIYGYAGDGGPATSAEIKYPDGVSVDVFGNLYVADSQNRRIRMVTPGGTITTVAGNGAWGYTGDGGPATTAELWYPSGVAIDSSGNLYIADNDAEVIRKVTSSSASSAPFISGLSPSSATAGGAAFTLTINGYNFASGAVAMWGNTALSTTYVSATNLTAAVPASLIATVGTAVVTVTTSGVNSAAATFSINPDPQTITFPNPGAQTYGVAPITLTATSSSTLPVSYTVTSGPATVSGSTLTITGAGSVTVQATQAGNSSYAAATPVSVSCTVNKAPLTVTASSTSGYVGAPIPTLSGTLAGAVAGDGLSATYSTTAIVGSPAGSYPITAKLNDPNSRLSNYNVTNTPGTLTIMAAVTTTQSSTNFGQVAVGASTGNTQSLSFTISSGSTLGGISALTQGAPNLDFTLTGGTCTSGSRNTTCTVQVQFLPTAVGARLGAVVLTDQSGNTLITVPLYGIGTGPLVAFGPGTITTVAGEYRGPGATYGGYTGDNGPAISAQLSMPSGITFDGAGNLYIADYSNNVIRRVTPSGTITTVAGSGTYGYNGNTGSATSVELAFPEGVAVDGAGNLYIADVNNFRVRKVTPGGTLTTVAGVGAAGESGDGGPATSALVAPSRLAVDGAGNLYIADSFDNVIRLVTPGGTITTFAGNGQQGYSGDGGPATSAELFMPSGIAFDGAGNLYIADEHNNVIRKVAPGGTITTVAGNGTIGYSGDNGPAVSAQMNWPYDVAVDSAGNLYIADQENNLIRKVTPGGTITTIAGNNNAGPGYSGNGGNAFKSQLAYPWGVTLDGVGNLYIADSINNVIRKVDVADAPSLTFGSINVGQSSAAQDATVLNLGNAPLNISQISTASNFSLGGADTSCSSTSQTLAPAASCVLGIEFNPIADGSISGNVILTDNALNGSAAAQTIALQGTGFGQLSQTITFPNPGPQTYGVGSVMLGATATSGGSLQISDTVLNQGGGIAGASTTGFYLSTNGTIKGTYLGYRYVGTLNADASSGPVTTPLTLPTSLSGTYYVMACANYNNAVSESNTANNCTAAQIMVAGADLIESAVSILTTTPALGGSVQVSDTALNQGGGIAGMSTTGFYLSANGTTKGTYLGYRYVGTLNAGANSGAVTTTLTLPASMTGGNYYVIACANYSNGITESNTANNCTASSNTMLVP
jgi:sugar lactone lactonase YvrE